MTPNRYECAVNIEDLIKLSDVMTEHSLGPNGGEPAFLLFLSEAMVQLVYHKKMIFEFHMIKRLDGLIFQVVFNSVPIYMCRLSSHIYCLSVRWHRCIRFILFL